MEFMELNPQNSSYDEYVKNGGDQGNLIEIRDKWPQSLCTATNIFWW